MVTLHHHAYSSVVQTVAKQRAARRPSCLDGLCKEAVGKLKLCIGCTVVSDGSSTAAASATAAVAVARRSLALACAHMLTGSPLRARI